MIIGINAKHLNSSFTTHFETAQNSRKWVDRTLTSKNF